MADLTRKEIEEALKNRKTQFPDMDFSGLDLSGLDFTGCNLHGTNLEGTDLTGATLDRADLSWAKMTGATLDSIKAADVVLYGSKADEGFTTKADVTEDTTLADAQIKSSLESK